MECHHAVVEGLDAAVVDEPRTDVDRDGVTGRAFQIAARANVHVAGVERASPQFDFGTVFNEHLVGREFTSGLNADRS